MGETIAILGSGFGPAATLTHARQYAAEIVCTTLQTATWLRWATLGKLLPLLAEASPNKFLEAIRADLMKPQPELAKVLADHSKDSLLLSRCHHAGLLWALEGLRGRPNCFPKCAQFLANWTKWTVVTAGATGPPPAYARFSVPGIPRQSPESNSVLPH